MSITPINGGLVSTVKNPLAFKTVFDEIFEGASDTERLGFDTATFNNPIVFNQKTTGKKEIVTGVKSGLGLFSETGEAEEYSEDDVKAPATSKVITVRKFTKKVRISEEALTDEDQIVGVAEDVKNLGSVAPESMSRFSFEIYNDAEAGASYTTNADLGAQPMLSNSHTAINGITVDNLITDALDIDAITSLRTKMQSQRNHRGVVIGSMGLTTLMFPDVLKETAYQVFNTPQVLGSNNNDLNPVKMFGYETIFSTYIDALKGGSDTRFFGLSRGNHSVCRYVREGITTSYVHPDDSTDGVGFYKAKFRQQMDVQSYVGVVGSAGTA